MLGEGLYERPPPAVVNLGSATESNRLRTGLYPYRGNLTLGSCRYFLQAATQLFKVVLRHLEHCQGVPFTTSVSVLAPASA